MHPRACGAVQLAATPLSTHNRATNYSLTHDTQNTTHNAHNTHHTRSTIKFSFLGADGAPVTTLCPGATYSVRVRGRIGQLNNCVAVAKPLLLP